jgi:uncharacterized protein (TIGR03084 family)
MDVIIKALVAQCEELRELGAPLRTEDWNRQSRCDDWTLADVVLHLAQTNELATASLQDRFQEVVDEFVRVGGAAATSVDDAADVRVALERNASAADIFDRWSASADDLLAALRSADPHARVTWVAGRLSAHTLATTRLAETWIHTGDVACGLGVAPTLTPQLRHIVRLAWRTLPYAFSQAGRSMSGPVALDLAGANGERWTFGLQDAPVTTITGDALELCLVAGRRLEPTSTSLRADGPDGDAVLALIRTYA